MRPGSKAIFHEYAHYLTWRFIPRLRGQERFAEEVKAELGRGRRKSGHRTGSADLSDSERLCGSNNPPRIYCVGPSDYMWQWPASFVGIGLARLQELGRIDADFADQVKDELSTAAANPDSRLGYPARS